MSNTDDDEIWSWIYGTDCKKIDDEYEEYHFIMAGGGDHWWKYVIQLDDIIYILSKDGYEKKDGILIMSDCKNYLSIQEKDYQCLEDEWHIQYNEIREWKKKCEKIVKT